MPRVGRDNSSFQEREAYVARPLFSPSPPQSLSRLGPNIYYTTVSRGGPTPVRPVIVPGLPNLTVHLRSRHRVGPGSRVPRGLRTESMVQWPVQWGLQSESLVPKKTGSALVTQFTLVETKRGTTFFPYTHILTRT